MERKRYLKSFSGQKNNGGALFLCYPTENVKKRIGRKPGASYFYCMYRYVSKTGLAGVRLYSIPASI